MEMIKLKIKLKFFLVTAIICIGFSSVVIANDNTFDINAFEKINFKDSPEVVKQKIKDSDTIKTLLYGSTPYIFINDYTYLMNFEYHDDKLYRIDIRSLQEGANFFDTKIKDQLDTLVNTIIKQYNKPDHHRKISILNMDNQYIQWSHIWKVDGIKQIKIGIGEVDYNYYAALWIEYLPILEEIEAEKEKEKNKSNNQR